MNTSDDSDIPFDHRGTMWDIEVEISDTQNHLKLDREALIRLVRDTLRAESKPFASISLAIVDNSTIQALNRTHLNHDWPTDVISFLFSDDDVLQAELILSAEMAVETAREANLDPWHEFALYVVHGLLHLRGHDDTSEPKRTAMRTREGEILASLGLTNTFSAIAPSLTESEGYAP